MLLIVGLVRSGRQSLAAPAVGAWVTAVIIATVSTGFANPAATIARALTGIAPPSVPALLVAELSGGALAAAAAVMLFPAPEGSGADDTDLTEQSAP